MSVIIELFNRQNLIIKILIICFIIYILSKIIKKMELFVDTESKIKPGYLLTIDNEFFTFSDGNTYKIMKPPIDELKKELDKDDYNRKSYCLKFITKDTENIDIYEIIDC